MSFDFCFGVQKGCYVRPSSGASVTGVYCISDALDDLGVEHGATVRLQRADGLKILHLVTGSERLDAEDWIQRDSPKKSGFSRLIVANLVFEWPDLQAVAEEASRGQLEYLPSHGKEMPNATNDNVENLKVLSSQQVDCTR
jgi:hypothetical protein